ncbi:MAG: hypothetical protein GY947_20820 [Rhodobacteraceae bacterium]|nr:hypothetical protein [Paracoccaceae bacterium]
MQPATQRMSFQEDVPVLFLAWLVPTILFLLFSAQQAWVGALLSPGDLPKLPSLRDAFSITEGAKTLVGYVWPLFLLLTLIVGIACQALQVTGKRGMLIAVTYCAVSLTVLAHFAPGNLALSAFQLVLLISLLGFCLYSRQAPQLAIGAGLCAAAMLATGFLMAPFVLAAVIWIAAEWALDSGEKGESSSRKVACFGYCFAFGTIFLGLFEGAEGSAISPACGPLSLPHVVPAALAGVGLAHLANTAMGPTSAKHKLGCLGFLTIAVFSSIVAINPSCMSPASFGSISETVWPWGQGTDRGLFALFAQDSLNAYTIAATPLIGLFTACYAATTSKQQRSAWALLLGSLGIAVALMAYDTNFAIFANALAIIPCAFLTLLAGQISRTTLPAPFTSAVFVVVWLSGMNFVHVTISKYVVPGTLAHQSKAEMASSNWFTIRDVSKTMQIPGTRLTMLAAAP